MMQEAADTTALFLRYVEKDDSAALGEIFSHLQPSLRQIPSRLRLDPATIEDVLQSSFVVVVEKSERFQLGSRVRHWIGGIVFREAHAAARVGRRQPDRERIPAVSSRRPDQLAVENELLARICRAMDGLAPASRQVAEMHVLAGLDPVEIACRLNCGPSTVRSRLARGLAKIRQRLAVEGS